MKCMKCNAKLSLFVFPFFMVDSQAKNIRFYCLDCFIVPSDKWDVSLLCFSSVFTVHIYERIFIKHL